MISMPSLRLTAVLLALPILAASVAHSQTTPATLTLDLQAPRAKVSPMLYGLMTEEINFSYDGGLYAEMVRNRTFQDSNREPEHWYLIQDGNAQAELTMDKSTGPSDALPTSLRIDVKQADEKNQAGVLNEGFWGMALRPNTTYKGSLYARAKNGKMGPLQISLVSDNSGKPVATATVPDLSTSWKRYDFSLKTGDITASTLNHLALKVGHAGSVWIDLVSLFPPTYKDRENGNRVDLMEKLAEMHPAFLRFPGGNYLEGDDIWDRYEWKTTIGPLVDRPTHPSPWRYHSSDGLGLLEFFEWCEDLHMQPVLAVYAGYSMKQEHIQPGPKLEPFVQDALDEIEYATGSTNTKWGAERAKDGHPAPFHLTYVEIGNEDWFDRSGSYEGRYAQFYKAIKGQYPELQLIATTPVKDTKPDVVDDHYYRRASEFFGDTQHYDKTDRNGPKIFVGEWATREGTPTPNFGAALGDAAWMTGMERNSDLIVMAAYAPLLVNINPGGMQWETDLIGYNAMESYGSPSYYAQVMFSKYIGTEILKGELNGANSRCFYSATYSPDGGKLYVKLVNASSTAQPITLKLSGADHLQKSGTVVSLSAHSTQETNTISNPERIKPVESELKNVSGSFDYVLAPYSIDVLELKTR
jgi:alpha-N-arabinofuranosidase